MLSLGRSVALVTGHRGWASTHQPTHGRASHYVVRRTRHRTLRRGGSGHDARDLAHDTQPNGTRWPLVPGAPEAHDRARPDHHARRLRGAGGLDGHADRGRGARRPRALRLGLHLVHARVAHRHRRHRRPDRPPRAWGSRSWPASASSRSGSWSAASRHRCPCSSRPASCRAWGPAPSRRSPTWPSGAVCRSASAHRCSRRSPRPGCCPASWARPSPASSARRSAGAGSSWACCR